MRSIVWGQSQLWRFQKTTKCLLSGNGVVDHSINARGELDRCAWPANTLHATNASASTPLNGQERGDVSTPPRDAFTAAGYEARSAAKAIRVLLRTTELKNLDDVVMTSDFCYVSVFAW